MHQFSFDSGDPFFDLGGWQVGLQVITFENVYGLDPELTRVEEDGGRWTGTAGGGGRGRGAGSSARGRSGARRCAVSSSSCESSPPATSAAAAGRAAPYRPRGPS